jgi:hypothetical protein
MPLVSAGCAASSLMCRKKLCRLSCLLVRIVMLLATGELRLCLAAPRTPCIVAGLTWCKKKKNRR